MLIKHTVAHLNQQSILSNTLEFIMHTVVLHSRDHGFPTQKHHQKTNLTFFMLSLFRHNQAKNTSKQSKPFHMKF